MRHLPSELFGGQKQRAATACVLVNNSPIILVGEPTSTPDTKTSGQTMQLLTELNCEGKAIAMITHELETADFVTRKVVICDGKITRDMTDSVRTD